MGRLNYKSLNDFKIKNLDAQRHIFESKFQKIFGLYNEI